MFTVYILCSESKERYYTGHTENINTRIKKHNSKQVPSTRYGIPWKIIYTEVYSTKQDAYRREFEIKSYRSGPKFKKLLGL